MATLLTMDIQSKQQGHTNVTQVEKQLD